MEIKLNLNCRYFKKFQFPKKSKEFFSMEPSPKPGLRAMVIEAFYLLTGTSASK